MKITLDIKGGSCLVTREAGDPIFHRGGWGDAESQFLYHVKKALIKMGYDVIKKRMWKDGHMVDDHQQYIRTRITGKEDSFCIVNGRYACCDAGEEFNKYGEYEFYVYPA